MELGTRDGVGDRNSCVLNVVTEGTETNLIVVNVKVSFSKFLVV